VTDYRLLPAGDTALSVEFGDRVDRQLSSLVLALARRLNEAKIGGVVECVPTFRSLMVYYEPLLLPFAALTERIDTLMQGLRPTQTAGRSWRLPVCYDDSLAPDLGDVAKRTNLTQAQVIERHSALTYHVYMLGFLPGQPYMGDVAHELALPRRQSPRMRIPAGSLADHDVHLPVGNAVRLASYRTVPGSALESAQRRFDATAAAGRQGRFQAGFAPRI
jgi:inhibitor of KinA